MKRKVKGIFASIALGVMTIAQAITVLASDTSTFSTGDNFTQLFHTRGFMGNAEILTKLSFISGLVSAVISVCGFIGVSLTVIRLMISLLYKSNPRLFDEIDEIKKSNTWSGGEGIKGNIGGAAKFFLGGSLNGVKEKSGGGVIDTIIWFVLGAMPNVKQYSDFASDANSGDGDNMANMSTTQYLLKVSPKIIMQIFFFSIAWNGVLFQAYGSVVDAMGVAAERVVNEDLTVAVENALDTGKKYSFSFKNDGTKFGEFQQKVAEEMYQKSAKKMSKSTRSQQQYHEVGYYIDGVVANLPKELVEQVGSNRSGKMNMSAENEEELFNSKKWENTLNSFNVKDLHSEKIKVFSEIVDEKTKKSKDYEVYRYTDNDGKIVCYMLNNTTDGVKNYKTVDEVGAATLQIDDESVYGHLTVNADTMSRLPVGVTADTWDIVNGALTYATVISNVGGDSGVSWNVTSEKTPDLYLVCNICYMDNSSAGTTYFQKVARDGKGISQDTFNKPASDDKSKKDINDGIH